jgi:hypothetical protein
LAKIVLFSGTKYSTVLLKELTISLHIFLLFKGIASRDWAMGRAANRFIGQKKKVQDISGWHSFFLI